MSNFIERIENIKQSIDLFGTTFIDPTDYLDRGLFTMNDMLTDEIHELLVKIGTTYDQYTTMEPYTCGQGFTPKAFKVEDLEHEIKVLFGEETNIPLANVKLQNNCIGGYAYIPERGEFVEGKCDVNTATSFKADKKLKEAWTNRNTVTLVEEVKYIESEKMELPDYLKSGTYYYTFRLDMNYNYVLISKTYESKY